jgi:hypothetical protein
MAKRRLRLELTKQKATHYDATYYVKKQNARAKQALLRSTKNLPFGPYIWKAFEAFLVAVFVSKGPKAC